MQTVWEDHHSDVSRFAHHDDTELFRVGKIKMAVKNCKGISFTKGIACKMVIKCKVKFSVSKLKGRPFFKHMP